MAETTQIEENGKDTGLKVTKQMMIGEIVAKYPEVAEIIMGEGVHCVGCGAANWETLEQGLQGHGKSDEQIDQLVVNINEFLSDNPVEEKGDFKPEHAKVKITQDAANKLNEILKKQGKENQGLRVAVKAGGCSGKTYELTFEDSKDGNDTVIEVHGAKFYFDKNSLRELDGSTIDYVDSLQGAGFKIENPNAKSSCGCGDSFS